MSYRSLKIGNVKQYRLRGGTILAQTVTALPQIAWPAGKQVSNSDGTTFTGTYDGTTDLIGADSNPRWKRVTDPSGSGTTVYDTRVYQGDTVISGGIRSEMTFDQSTSFDMIPGTEEWEAGAFQIGAFTSGSASNDQMLVVQTHTRLSGDTQPPVAFRLASKESGFSNTLTIGKAWQTAAPSGGSTNTEGTSVLLRCGLPAVGSWVRYIKRTIPGWTQSHNPLLQIWLKPDTALASVGGGPSIPASTWTLAVDDSAPGAWNAYNDGGNSAYRGYRRHGNYKWTSTIWSGSTYIQVYQMRMCFNYGTNLYDNAVAAFTL